ncbi:MAG: patatin-like phospholipase family protein [Myxococcales bacterium]|nr:patatin-like phospholipase family protein [Myxococcales bacterium]
MTVDPGGPIHLIGKRLGLALGAGAIHGAAHIGVLKALEERFLRPDLLAGTSIGALVAALYAFGLAPGEIETIALEMDWLDVGKFAPNRLGLMSIERLERRFEERVGRVRFEDARIPFAVIATDIGTGEAVVLREGPVASAVAASACIPGVFHPIERDGRLLVDGGLVESVPLSPLRTMGAEFTIGVNLGHRRRYRRPKNLIELLSNVFDVATRNRTKTPQDVANLLIAPNLGSYRKTWADAEEIEEMIAEGHRAATEALESLAQAADARPGVESTGRSAT